MMITFLLLLVLIASVYLMAPVSEAFTNPRATLCDRIGILSCALILVIIGSAALNTLIKVNS